MKTNLYLAILGIVLVAVLFAGCGGGGKILPPPNGSTPNVGDEPSNPVSREPILTVIREVSGAPKGVRVRWLASSQDGIAAYNIYRARASFTVKTDALKVNAAPLVVEAGQMGEYDDLFAITIGDRIFYRLTSIDAEGDESALSPEMTITIANHFITALSSETGGSGDVITITGANFGDYNPTNDRVFFRGLTWAGRSGSGLNPEEDASSLSWHKWYTDRAPSAMATETFIQAAIVSWSNESISVEVPIYATQGTVRVRTNNANGDYDGIFSSTDPYILSATPDPVQELDELVIAGANFGSARSVSFVNFGLAKLDQDANFVGWTNNEIRMVVPQQTPGNMKLEVRIVGQPATNSLMISTAAMGDPVIDFVNPLSAGSTQPVEIIGNNFGAYVTTDNFVEVFGIAGAAEPSSLRSPSALAVQGQVRARVLSWSNKRIVFGVPQNATSGAVTVIRGAKTARFAGPFTSTDPYLLSVLPDPVPVAELVTLQGNNFGNTRGSGFVRFGNIQLGSDAQYAQWTNTQIQCFTPGGIVGDTVVRVTARGYNSNALTIVITIPIPAVITDVTPQKAGDGSLVTITGTKFGANAGTIAVNGVTINGTSVPPDPNLVGWTDTQIQFNVPQTAELIGQILVNTLDGRQSNGWFYRRGVDPDPAFADRSWLFAGEMTGIGSDAVCDGTYCHFFTIATNADEIRHIRMNTATGLVEEFTVTSDYPGLTGPLAVAYDGTALWLAFLTNNRVYLTSSNDGGDLWNLPAEEVWSVPAIVGGLAIDDVDGGGVELAWGDTASTNIYHAEDLGGPSWTITQITNGYGGGDVGLAIQNPTVGTLKLISFNEQATNELTVFNFNAAAGWREYIGPVDTGGTFNSITFTSGGTEPTLVYRSVLGNLRIATEQLASPGFWTVGDIGGTNGLGMGIDIIDDGVNTLYIATGSDAAVTPDPYLVAFDYGAGVWTINRMFDINHSYSSEPAIVLDTNGDVFSLHTDQNEWNHWLVTWDLSGAGNHTSADYGDAFGDLDTLDGGRQAAMDTNGGTGFLFKDSTKNNLLFGYTNNNNDTWGNIANGTANDFNTAALDFDGTLFHIFYDRATFLMHRTVNPMTMAVSPEDTIAPFGDAVYSDIAVLAGRDGNALVTVMFIETYFSATSQRLLQATQQTLGGPWQVSEVLNLGGIGQQDGFDFAINPENETPVVSYFFTGDLMLIQGTYDGATWTFGAVETPAASGSNPITEYVHGVGLEVLGYNQSTLSIENLVDAPDTQPWTVSVVTNRMTGTSPYDMYGCAMPFGTGTAWGLANVYYSDNLKLFGCTIRQEDGTATNIPIQFEDPLGIVNSTLPVVDSQGGLTVVYSGTNDFGIYITQQMLALP